MRVELVRRAVVARLIEAAAAREQAQGSRIVLHHQQRILAVHIARIVHRAALRGRLLNVAVGADQPACAQQSPGPALRLRQQAVVIGAFAAVARAEFGAHRARAAPEPR